MRLTGAPSSKLSFRLGRVGLRIVLEAKLSQAQKRIAFKVDKSLEGRGISVPCSCALDSRTRRSARRATLRSSQEP